MTTDVQKPITGWHVLSWLVAFFIVVGAVNAVYVFVALDSWSGLESDNAYNDGLEYNEVLAARKAQTALGWTSGLETVRGANGSYTLIADFRDKYNQPLETLGVTAEVKRPTHEGYDVPIELTHIGQGRYQASLDLPLKGMWDVYVRAERGSSDLFVAKSRIMIE